MCVYVCLSSRLKKINTTGVASVKPGEANLRQMQFCQMKFAKWSFTKWSSPNEVLPNKKSFGQKKSFDKNVKKKKKFRRKCKKKKFQRRKNLGQKHKLDSWEDISHMWRSHMVAAD